MRLCLDTSAYSHFKAAEPQAVGLISQAKLIGVPSIVLGELRSGFLRGSRSDKNETELRAFLLSSPVRVLDVDAEASKIYAQIVAELREKGTPIPTNDIWIASVAAREGLPVLTFDDHFERIARVSTYLLKGNQGN